MKKYLRCHTEAFGLTKGALYQIRREDDEDYMIIDDIGIRSYYGIYSDDGDGYYGDYFTLEFVPDSGANVTVLKDESLGGIEREYREVKRKANVGELAKVIGGSGHKFDVNDVVTAVSLNPIITDGVDFKRKDGEVQLLSPRHGDYVVLEPSEIVRIDGERLRMVDRKAAVGERVVIVNAVDEALDLYGYATGQIYEVKGFTGSDPDIWPDGTDDTAIFLEREEYRVLEPVETAKTTAPTAPLSAQSPLDQAAANISALQAQVKALESRVAALEKTEEPVKVAEGPADDTPPSFIAPPKPPQQLRDEIVERAKADLEGVKNPWNISVYPQPLVYTYKHYVVDVEFVVNREKRTVVAIARWRHNGKIVSRGIAKCAPNDVFNAHIGRAIALRRALGLEVPAEYLNVPNPEEPRVGDVVADKDYGVGVVSEMRPKGYLSSDEGLTVEGCPGSAGYWTFIRDVTILDDSREEVAA